MGGSGSKTDLEPKLSPDPSINHAFEESVASCSLSLEELSIIEDLEVESASEAEAQPQRLSKKSAKKLAKQERKIENVFKDLLDTCISTPDQSLEAIQFKNKEFSTLSAKKLAKCFKITFDSLQNNFDKLSIHRDILIIIYRSTEKKRKSKDKFSAAFKRICRENFDDYFENSKWNEIIRLSALLCELSIGYYLWSSFFVMEVNFWIEKIIEAAINGSEHGLITYMLILNRLIKDEIVFKQLNRGYFKILRTLLDAGDKKSKLKIIQEYLSITIEDFDITEKTTDNPNLNKPKKLSRREQKNQRKQAKTSTVDDAGYLEEIENSQKCKDFDDYFKSRSNGTDECCEFFSNATKNELEYFARKIIENVIEKPKEIKMIGLVLSKYQTSLIRTRKFFKDLVKSIEDEFESLKQSAEMDKFEIANLGKLLGELYVCEKQIVPHQLMTNYLTYLTDNGDIATIASTLKLCGYFYKQKNLKHYEYFMDSINIFRPIVENEIANLTENFENSEQIWKSRLFKPEDSTRKVGSLEMTVTGIAESKNVSYNYEVSGMLHINTKRLIKLILKSLQKPDANVIELAKFLKSFYDFTFQTGSFIQKLKNNLESRILGMISLAELKTLGLFVAELRTLNVTNDGSQKLWLAKMKTFDLNENLEAIEVYVDVVKAMLVNIQIHEYEKLLEINQNLIDIRDFLESSDTESAEKLKSKIAQIFQNIVPKKVDSATSEIFFKIRHGHRIDGLPSDMPESDPNVLDIRDFAKIFYINAISNHYFTISYANSIKHLKSGSKGQAFIQSLRDTLSANIFPNILSSDFCESDEAIGTFQFIVKFFNEKVLTESEIISFLEIILEYQDMENHRECVGKFIEDLQMIVDRSKRRNVKKFGPNLEKMISKVQLKLREVDVEDVRVRTSEDDSVESQSEVLESNNVEFKSDQFWNSNFNEIYDSDESDGSSEKYPQSKMHDAKSLVISDNTEFSGAYINLQPESSPFSTQIKADSIENLPKVSNTEEFNTTRNEQCTQAKPSTEHEELNSKSDEITQNNQPKKSAWQEIFDLLKEDEENENGISSILLEHGLEQTNQKKSNRSRYDKIHDDLTQDDETSKIHSKETFSDNFPKKSQNDNAAQKSAPTLLIPPQNDKTPFQFPSIHSENLNIPGLTESYNEILPVITTSTSFLRRHAIVIYSWGLDDSAMKLQVKELVGLLSTELRRNHKQLLNDVSKELIDECDKIRRYQGLPKNKAKELSQLRNAYILTFRAVHPFLEKRHIYDILNFMLIQIRDGNRVALDLFLDVTEIMENIFEVECYAKDSFLKFCVEVLQQAARFKNAEPQTVKRTFKMLQYFKNLTVKPKRSPSIESNSVQGSSSNQLDEFYVSPWPDKPRRGRRGGRRSRDSSQSTQVSGISGVSSRSTRRSRKRARNLASRNLNSSQVDLTTGKSSQVDLTTGKSSQVDLTTGKSRQVNLTNETSAQNIKSSLHLSQASLSSGTSSQNTKSNVATGPKTQSNAQPSQPAQNSSSNVIKDPPTSFKTDVKVMFYINQLQTSNSRQLGPKLTSIIADGFSKVRFMEILLQKGISEEKFIKPAIELFEYLFKNNNVGQAKLALADEIGNEFISLCEDGGKLEQKMLNLVKFTKAFDPYLQGSFLYQLWSQLLEFVEQDCPNSLKVLILLMHDKADILYETREQKRFMKYVLMVFKRKIGSVKDKDLLVKMRNMIKNFEKGEASSSGNKNNSKVASQSGSNSQNKINEPVNKPKENIMKIPKPNESQKNNLNDLGQHRKPSIPSENIDSKIPNIDKNHAKVVEKLTKDINLLCLGKEVPVPSLIFENTQFVTKTPQLPVETTNPKFQLPSNKNFLQIHTDDAVRPLDFKPDYFLFDNAIENPQKFERILSILCENCQNLENRQENLIKIKEFIAVAIININFLKTQNEVAEFEKFAKIFYELYTQTDQTKHMQWILVKFLKALNLNDQNLSGKMTNIYDRYSKSVLRIKKSFMITKPKSEEEATKVDDKKTTADNITSKSESLLTTPNEIDKTGEADSNFKGLVAKSKPTASKSRTITLVFDDLVPKTDKSTKLDASKKAEDILSKSEDIASKPSHATKSDEQGSNFNEKNPKSNDITSKNDNITSKSVTTCSKSDDATDKTSINTPQKSTSITLKLDDIPPQPKNLTSKPKATSISATKSSKSSSSASIPQPSFFINFMTSLHNLIYDQLTSTTVNMDRDPFFDYFSLKKKKAYEIVCDLYFQGLTPTNFVVSCVMKMFEHPIIIEKNMDVVVRMMKLVDQMVRIRNKDKNFLEVLKPFWLRLPFGVELMFQISVDKWTMLKNFLQKAMLFRSNSIEFRAIIENLWSELMENPDKFCDVVQVFEDFLEVLGDSFAVLIEDFIENRRASLEKFPYQKISKAISIKYKISILFAFELFEMGILNCENFSKWLNGNVCGKLMQGHLNEILIKIGRNGLKIDEFVNENLKNYYKELNLNV